MTMTALSHATVTTRAWWSGLWRQSLARLLPHWAALCLVLVAAGLSTLASLMQPTRFGVFPDTLQYLDAAHHILTDHQLNDVLRTPGYPGFLALIFFLTGGEHWGAVVTAQTALTICAALEIYVLLYRIAHRRWIASLIAVVIALNLYITAWERSLLSETLAYWLLVTTFLVLERYLRTDNNRYLAAFAVLNLAAIMVRPQFLYLPVALLALLAIRAMRYGHLRMTWKPLVLSGVLVYAVVLAYMGANARDFGFFGLTKTSNIILLGKVLELHAVYRMPVTGADPRFARFQENLLAFNPKGADAWGFLKRYPQYDSDSGQYYGTFSMQVLEHHPVAYLQGTFRDFVTVTSWNQSPAILLPYTKQPLWLRVLLILSNWAEGLGYAPLVLLLFGFAIMAWRGPRQDTAFLLFAMIAVAVSHVLIATAGNYESFDRLRFPADWIVISITALVAIEMLIGHIQLRLPDASAPNPSMEASRAKLDVVPASHAIFARVTHIVHLAKRRVS